ncbi:MAG: diaminopimelate decarboxylase [Clostridia bacterium]|nr:diaminopimelate decarboxylase [Clostridia bacterium]
MRLQGTMKINDKGHLEIGGCDVVDLAASLGTPLYILDEALLRQNCRRYYQAFTGQNENDLVLYASKAFLVLAMARIIQDEGLGLDVVSGGELAIALTAGFPAEKIFLHGNNKSAAEIRYALRCGVGRIVVDNYHELELVERICGEMALKAAILLRIAPGIEAHSHSYISTGQVDSKFGFTMENGDALRAVKKALASPHFELKGVHCHIGSQILDLEAFRLAGRVMMDFLAEARQRTGWTAEELDLGGGLGVYYSEGDDPPTIEEYARAVKESVADKCREHAFPRPRIIVEPGRSIVSPAGTTLYTIGSMKDIPGIRKYVAVDGGMTDNPRPALYQAKYEGLIANKAAEEAAEVVSITGRCCESGDMLIWDLPVPRVEAGDLLAIFSTGAYNYSMSSNYNALLRPAVVLVLDGKADVIVERETWGDLIRNHRLPERLL